MSGLLKNLNFTYFLAAFALGLLFTYAFTPPPQVVVKFPSPYNAGSVIYRDKSDPDSCYKYRAEKQAACPKDAARVKEQPITEDFKSRRT